MKNGSSSEKAAKLKNQNVPQEPAEAEEIEVLFFEDDPDWTLEWDAVLREMLGYERQALGWKWTGKYQVESLARALVIGTPIPVQIRTHLATMFAPHPEWRGPRLKVSAPQKKSIRDIMEKLAKTRKIRTDYEEMTAQHGRGSSDSVIEDLKKKYGVRRSNLHEAIKTKDVDIVREFEKILGVRIARAK